jgi:CBS domain-containing protein
MSVKVSQVLATKGREVDTVASTASVRDAARILAAKKIGALVVTDDGATVAGIISERDVVRVLASDQPNLDALVSSVMTSRVTTCAESDTVDSLMGIMTEGRFRHMPVVTDGKIAGMISIGDVVKSRTQELVIEANALKDYVTGSNY